MSKVTVIFVVCFAALIAAFAITKQSPGEVALPTTVANAKALDVNPDARRRLGVPAPTGSPRLEQQPPEEKLLDRTSFSADEWIASLPTHQRERARQFVSSYSTGYLIKNAAERDWILLHGYPSLEEVVSFSPDEMPGCPPHSCRDPKVAALGADHLLNGIEKQLAETYANELLPEDYLGKLPEDTKIELVRRLADIQGYIAQARDNGSLMFAAHLRGRMAKLVGNDVEADGADALLVACGDPRVTLSDPAAQRTALAIIGSMPKSIAVCGYSPQRPTFPK